jgi:hypothetical protein
MIGAILFSAAMGWCGTPYPGWFWHRKPGPPDPDPWWLSVISSIIGGVIGGAIMHYTLSSELTAIGLASFAGGRIISGIVGSMAGSMKQ